MWCLFGKVRPVTWPLQEKKDDQCHDISKMPEWTLVSRPTHTHTHTHTRAHTHTHTRTNTPTHINMHLHKNTCRHHTMYNYTLVCSQQLPNTTSVWCQLCLVSAKPCTLVTSYPCCGVKQCMYRVGQNCIYTPYMTVYMVNSLPKIPYTHRIFMVLANPNDFSEGVWQVYSVCVSLLWGWATVGVVMRLCFKVCSVCMINPSRRQWRPHRHVPIALVTRWYR